MLKTIIIGAIAGVGAFAAVAVVGTGYAAEERCRVDVAAFIKDLQALKALQPDINADELRKLLQQGRPKP